MLFELFIVIMAGVACGIASEKLLWLIGQLIYLKLKKTDFKAMAGKLSKRKAREAELARIRKEVRILLDTKPAKVTAYKKGDRRIVDYLKSRLKGLKADPLDVHTVLMEELNK